MARILAILSRGTVWAGLLASAGCAAIGPPAPLAGDGFHARGRLAVRDGSDGYSASFDWRQQGERYRIDLWGPLGQGRLRITGDDEALTVADARGVIAERGAGSALADRFGWPVPLGALRHWLLGRCDPAEPPSDRRQDERGNLASFSQHGWQVRMADWRQGASEPLPSRLVATQGQRRIAVAIREWR